jgi:hypothetical protein
MARKESHVIKIARATSKRFPFLSISGTDVDGLVRFILAKRNALEKEWFKKNIGDDARDYMNSAYLLEPLSNETLSEIENLGYRDIRRRLKEKIYPFSRLSKKSREILLSIPNSWIHGSADWLLKTRRLKSSSAQVRILAD